MSPNLIVGCTRLSATELCLEEITTSGRNMFETDVVRSSSLRADFVVC